MALSNKLPGWVSLWLLVTTIVCIWDAGFIVLRPHTLPGGSLHKFWAPYKLYIEVDTKYADMTSNFAYAVALMNFAEIGLNILTLLMNAAGSPRTVPLAFTTCVMTGWKTVLYLLELIDWGDGGTDTNNASFTTRLLLLWIPNGIWILLPFACVFSLWGRLVDGQKAKIEKRH